jgi:hypothetical protein
MSVNSRWLRNLKGKEKEDMEATYKSSSRLRKHMKEVLGTLEKEVQDSLLSVDKNGDWSIEVAEKIGELKAYKNFTSMLK